MNQLVKIIHCDENGESIQEPWHLEDPTNFKGPALLCTQEFYHDIDPGIDGRLWVKEVLRGGITCPECLRMIKLYKAVSL